MKILFTGSDAECSLERWYAEHLKEDGIDVRLFPAQSIFYQYYGASLKNKLLYKAGLSSIYRRINELLNEEVDRFRPDVIWIFKGMEIMPSFLARVKEKGIRVVNFNPDNPFLFSGPGSGNKNVTRSIGSYDLHLTYDPSIRARIEKEYQIPAFMLPFGFELTDALYRQCIAQEEVAGVCFLGNPDVQRASFLRQLSEKVPVHVYGHDWSAFLQEPGVTIFGPVYGDEFWKVLYRYRLQLNLMRVHNPQSHNMRSFEIPGVGGIGLFPDTPDHRLYFEDKKEVFLFRDLEECAELARQILEMSGQEAGQIRQNARLKSVSSGYSYKERVRSILPLLFPTHG